MNTHIIHGRLVRDPQLTQAADPAKDRCNFTVAVSRRYGDEADFFDCTVFGKRAGVISKYFQKGSEIALTGEGQIRKYEDKNGVKKQAYSILVHDFDFCGKSQKMQEGTSPDIPEGFETVEDIKDDVPF